MYHLRLRQFPHNLNRFNVSEPELWAILEPWARGEMFELEERKWSPHTAKLTILEGPQLPLDELAMGRGWGFALHESEDVTDRLLARAREAIAAPAQPAADAAPPAAATRPPAGAGASEQDVADPLGLGVQLAELLGSDPARLLAIWRRIAAATPGLSPSESLGRAERELGPPAAG